MSLKEFLKTENLKAAEMAKRANVPKSSISTHLKYEATAGQEGKRLGLELSLRLIEAYPSLSLSDIRADWAERLEAQHG